LYLKFGAMTFQPQIIKDADGNDIGVFIPKRDYDEIMEMLEEFEDAKDFDAAQGNNEQAIPVEQAFKEIEENRDDL
jgi:hypothetical protein